MSPAGAVLHSSADFASNPRTNSRPASSLVSKLHTVGISLLCCELVTFDLPAEGACQSTYSILASDFCRSRL